MICQKQVCLDLNITQCKKYFVYPEKQRIIWWNFLNGVARKKRKTEKNHNNQINSASHGCTFEDTNCVQSHIWQSSKQSCQTTSESTGFSGRVSQQTAKLKTFATHRKKSFIKTTSVGHLQHTQSPNREREKKILALCEKGHIDFNSRTGAICLLSQPANQRW